MAGELEPEVSTLEEQHQELMDDWYYRFWHYVYGLRYWIERRVIRFQIWRKRRTND